jgi:glutamate-1-semialdehyde 2,1-aminomutase
VGGVNSPVRAYAAVGGQPPVIASAAGSAITDVDGNVYVDYVGSWGPAILGHAPPAVVEAICRAAARGCSFGAPAPDEAALAEQIASHVPSIQKLRFTSSGTEAVMSAIRLARGATGRSKVMKCAGCYHGHCDAMLVAAGSGAMTLGTPSSPGVPPGAAADTIIVPYNDLAAMRQAARLHAADLAAVLVEPVAGNMGVVPPADGYLAGLRELCDQTGALLIFDEVITGFRLGLGGAQGLYGVKPDLTTLGKIIGGGMPVGAFGGRADIMRHLAPEGPVYQAGTLSGNPVAMAAGLATLRELMRPGFYDELDAKAASLEAGLRKAAAAAGLAGKVCFTRAGSMMCCFFTPGPVTDYASAARSDTRAFAAYFRSLLDSGIYIAPSQFEAMFVSAAHGEQDLARTISAAEKAFLAAATAITV